MLFLNKIRQLLGILAKLIRNEVVFDFLHQLKIFVIVSGNQTGCDPGWTQHIDTCYLAVPVKQTWKMAQIKCINQLI